MGILNNLGLENANFVIDFEEVKASEQGIENIKFLLEEKKIYQLNLIDTNPKNNPQPPSKV